jgi:hypothetical protein
MHRRRSLRAVYATWSGRHGRTSATSARDALGSDAKVRSVVRSPPPWAGPRLIPLSRRGLVTGRPRSSCARQRHTCVHNSQHTPGRNDNSPCVINDATFRLRFLRFCRRSPPLPRRISSSCRRSAAWLRQLACNAVRIGSLSECRSSGKPCAAASMAVAKPSSDLKSASCESYWSEGSCVPLRFWWCS